ncbi:hypothetical protein, partial [Paenibacillus sp. FSL R7-0337]|uniref:hypothetical protein n=1 Tax=Paenibacillus sp. FSL R7-0337 TaxID=1926588 RepID=UPI001C4BABCE
MPMSSPGRPGCSLSSIRASAAEADPYGSGSAPAGSGITGVIPVTMYRRSPMARSSTSPLSRPRLYSARTAEVCRTPAAPRSPLT